MKRVKLSQYPHFLSISSFSLHFLPLFPFPTSKCITFCCKMLNTALLSRISQKSQHTRYEEIILGRTCCEEAPHFVPSCCPLPCSIIIAMHWLIARLTPRSRLKLCTLSRSRFSLLLFISGISALLAGRGHYTIDVVFGYWVMTR